MEKPMRILVCGDRNWTDRKAIYRVLSVLPHDCTIVEGGARGADSLARSCAEELGLKVEEFGADWKHFGRAAGPLRNQRMLDSGIDFCIAFHPDLAHSKGTLDMTKRCKRAGIPIATFSS